MDEEIESQSLSNCPQVTQQKKYLKPGLKHCPKMHTISGWKTSQIYEC